MNELVQDVRYALRAFTKSPAFAIAAILSLAIGIGANTAMFSVTNALLLRPLPYKDADRLVILWNRSPGLNITQDWFSTAQYFDIKTHQGFQQAAIAIGGNENLTGDGGEPERVGTIHVSANLLPMLGVQPTFGRLFVPEEDGEGRPPTAILGSGMWRRRYGGDPKMVGKSILINGKSYEVVGILPRSFSLPREVFPTLNRAEEADVLLPLPLGPDAPRDRNHEDYNVMARLRSGVSVGQAQAEMDTITARLRRDFPQVYPPNGGLTFGIVPLQEQVVGDARPALVILLGSVGFVLLIACANVANLLLSRAVGRSQEIAVRRAVGAGGLRIIRQLLTESILLALGGGIVGVLFSYWSIAGIRILGPESVPRLQYLGMDGRVLLFALLLSLFSGILFGLAPALRLTSLDVYSSLKDASRGTAGTSALWGRGNNMRRLLVISELALSVVLLIGAGLLIRSFARIENVAPGFNPKNVLTLELTMSGRKYDKKPGVLNAYRLLWDRLDRLPGVTGTGVVTSLPLSDLFAWGPITVEGRTPLPGENFINADMRVAGWHYFQLMEIPLIRGRLFDEHDTTDSPKVIVIDERMAQDLWPGQDPIGKRIHIGGISDNKAPWITVVGIVGGVKQYGLDSDSRIALYFPHAQYATRAMSVTLRTIGDPAALAHAVKQEIHAIDPDLPIYNVCTMEQRVAQSLARRRFTLVLLGAFAGLALALATIGIYSVMAYLVVQGTRELGIRMALGATPGGILGLVIRQGMTLAFSGIFIGLAAAFALTHLIKSLLFAVSATDPLTFVAIPALLALVAFLACCIPASRAVRIDPAISLRSE